MAFATTTSRGSLSHSYWQGGRPGAKTLLGAIFGRSAVDAETSADDARLDPDRPHFPEASTTVGKGRVLLESGYTFSKKGSSFLSYTYPEALLRIGLFADWFEVRLGDSFLREERTVGRVRGSAQGAQDLYLGVKLALAEQRQYLPRVALVPQMTVPTGSEAVTAGRVLPGLNVDCSWDVIKDYVNIELLIATNRVRADTNRSQSEIATGLTVGFNVRRDLETFIEWDAFYAARHSSGSGSSPRDYAVGGLVYFVSKNLALDLRAGVGLNKQANDFLAGVGFAVRY